MFGVADTSGSVAIFPGSTVDTSEIVGNAPDSVADTLQPGRVCPSLLP